MPERQERSARSPSPAPVQLLTVRNALLAAAALSLAGAVWIGISGLLARPELLAAQKDLQGPRQSVAPAPTSGALTAEEHASDSAHGVERLRVKVLEVLPHDPQAFTQGLEMAGGTLYEGTGLAGRSSVRAGPPGKRPSLQVALPTPLFGEGLTVLGRTLWQLTWRDGIAIERDARTLSELRRVRYPSEGWGVCHERSGNRLVTSDGSSRLTFRNPKTLARTGDIAVTQSGRPVSRLNELECVGDAVYANVLFTDRIVRIDPSTGAVTASIDAAGLLRADERVNGSVLNGIAAIPGTDQFLMTGKLWPKMFRVVFVPASRTGASGSADACCNGKAHLDM